MTALTELSLSYKKQKKQMKKLPPSIGDLTCLLKLNVENNQINQLPPQIGNLTGARLLGFTGTKYKY